MAGERRAQDRPIASIDLRKRVRTASIEAGPATMSGSLSTIPDLIAPAAHKEGGVSAEMSKAAAELYERSKTGGIQVLEALSKAAYAEGEPVELRADGSGNGTGATTPERP
jgi:hypothetical protein